ncbi:MAG: sulfatase-like hydrolase/transferase [Victivallales bacterium]|nr:sulfatase-like hydrolase/transferase [Victivallales bacterium]
MTRRDFLRHSLAALPALATASRGAPGDAPSRKNVIFIICDDLNDSIEGMGGHPQAFTPNLRRLAQRGVMFTNAHCNGPMCAPSRPSLLSGYYPSTTGLYHGPTSFRKYPALQKAKLFPEQFRDQGYAVYNTGKVFHGMDKDNTVFGTSEPATQPKGRNDYSGGYMGPPGSFGPYPWDGKTVQWNRPARDIPFGQEGVHWKRVKGKITLLPKGGGRWNGNPDLPNALQAWSQGFGRLSKPPTYKGPGYPKGYSYAGWAYGEKGFVGEDGKPGGTFRYHGPDDRSPMPDELCADWVIDLLAGREASSGVGGKGAAIAGRPFMMTCGLVKTHVSNYLPDEFFDAVLKHNGIKDASGIRLHALKGDKLLSDDLEDIPVELAKRGAGVKRFRQMIEAGKTYPGGAQRLFQEYVLAYLASVYEMDVQVGKLLDALDQNPELRRNTMLVFTSDHGWHNGEKQQFFKYTLWEEATRVPFLVCDPSPEFDAGRGKVCDHPVSLVDIYPTFCDLCGVAPPKASGTTPALDGHSLRPFLIDPQTRAWPGPAGALSTVWGGWDRLQNRPDLHHFTYRTRRWRYTLASEGGEELYDHRNDPHEWTNLASQPQLAAIKADLRRQLCALSGRTVEGNPAAKLPDRERWRRQ